MLQKARELLARIYKEMKERKATHPIVKENGITLTYDDDNETFGYTPGYSSIRNYKKYPIRFPDEFRTLSGGKLPEFIISKIGEGLDEFVVSIIEHKVIQRLTRKGGESRARSRFAGKSKEEVSEIMRNVRKAKNE